MGENPCDVVDELGERALIDGRGQGYHEPRETNHDSVHAILTTMLESGPVRVLRINRSKQGSATASIGLQRDPPFTQFIWECSGVDVGEFRKGVPTFILPPIERFGASLGADPSFTLD